MKKLVMAALAVAFAVFATTADARPHKKHRHFYSIGHHGLMIRKAVDSATLLPSERADVYASYGSTEGLTSRNRFRGDININNTSNGATGFASYEGGKPSYCYYVGPWCGCYARHLAGINDKAFDRAFSWLRLRKTGPQVGSYAVFGWSHVGKVVGFDSNGDPIVHSGNHNRRIATSTYPARRVLAYVDASSYTAGVNYSGGGGRRKHHRRAHYAGLQ